MTPRNFTDFSVVISVLSILKVISFFPLKSIALVLVEFTFSLNFLISFMRLVAWFARLLAIWLNLILAYFYLLVVATSSILRNRLRIGLCLCFYLLLLFSVVDCYVEECRGYYCPLWGSVNLSLG